MFHMSDTKDYDDLIVKIAALEERVNTKQAEYKTDIERLARQLAERDARMITVIVGMLVAGIAIFRFIA